MGFVPEFHKAKPKSSKKGYCCYHLSSNSTCNLLYKLFELSLPSTNLLPCPPTHPLLHKFHYATNLLQPLHQTGCLNQMITIKSQSVMKHHTYLHTFNFLSHNHMHPPEGHTLLVIQLSLEKHSSLIYFKTSLVGCSMMEGL